MQTRVNGTYAIGMAAISCLGCNRSTDPHDRRLLTGPKSSEVYAAWKEILALRQEDNPDRLAELERIAAVAEDATTGMLCRKCFTAFNGYQRVKTSLLTNIDAVISSHNVQHIAGAKRALDGSEGVFLRAKVPRHSSAKRQLNFTQVDNHSPSVVVGTYN